MPSKENRRKDKSSKEEGEVNENYTNSQKHNGAHPFDAGGASEGVDSNVNSHTHNQARGGGSNQGKASTSPKPTRKPTFEALTATANGTLQTLKEAEEKIKTLCSVVTLHANDLEKIDDTHRRLQESEEACKQKDGIIGRQENAILALNNIESRTMAQSKQEALKIEQEKLLLIQEREKMEQEKKKQDKRSAVVAAERNDKIDKEMERVTKHHNEVHEKRQQDLTAEFALKFDENDRRAKTFEAEKLRILTEVEDRNQQIKGLMEALKTSTDQCEMLDITKKSFKKELLDRQAELEAMKKEFDIEFQAIDYFERSFADIEEQIEGISGKYFYGIEGKDYDQVHDDLAQADPCFKSVLIDDSEDSRNLCMAHAQRVISKAICEDIWAPFSSESTASRPEFSFLLNEISNEIDKSDHSGRTARFWDARTVRALKSLSAFSVTSRSSESTEYLHPTRINSVITKVSVLSPLVSSSQAQSLRTDLAKLVNSAIDVWEKGQASGAKITVNLSLNRAKRNDWRSPRFDSKSKGGETNSELTYTAQHRIFALFPQIMALRVGNLVNHGSELPGSWPVDAEPTMIHHGRGLPEWSALVGRAQEDQEQHQDDLKAAFEEARKQVRSNKRALGSSRRDSKGSLIPGTPSDLWRREDVVSSPTSE